MHYAVSSTLWRAGFSQQPMSSVLKLLRQQGTLDAAHLKLQLTHARIW